MVTIRSGRHTAVPPVLASLSRRKLCDGNPEQQRRRPPTPSGPCIPARIDALSRGAPAVWFLPMRSFMASLCVCLPFRSNYICRSSLVPRVCPSALFACFVFVSLPHPHVFRMFSPVLLPGSYASFNLLGAYLGWPGYHYDSIPSYDD